MNKHVHRLVFDRNRGMRVPAAEHVRAAGKAAGGQQSAVALSVSTLLLAMSAAAWPQDALAQKARVIGTKATRAPATFNRANPLPIRSSVGSARRAEDVGQVDVHRLGDRLEINQTDQRVIINWASFDIAPDHTVQFNQPQSGSALNRIWDTNPSLIDGRLSATGEVILQNRNGFMFGRHARVDAARFVATALAVQNNVFFKGLRNVTDASAVFGNEADEAKGFITLERGAEIKAIAGGDVMMIAPQVYNEGRIETPQGQTILAAGQKVYLFTPEDPTQRGVVVAVDPFAAGPEGVNTVEQASAGEYKTLNGQTVDSDTPGSTAGLERRINEVIAEKGAINLVGMTVRQNGVLTATNAVKSPSGAIFLQAMKGTKAPTDSGIRPRVAQALGEVSLGAGSVTQVLPHRVEFEADPADPKGQALKPIGSLSGETFNPAMVEVFGQDVRVGAGAQVLAPSGQVTLLATPALTASTGHLNFKGNAYKAGVDGWDKATMAQGASLVIQTQANISVAGLRDVSLPMSRHQLQGSLFASELADAPVQRGGVLYRQEVFADARLPVGVANLTGFYNAIERNAQELSTTGGTLVINAQGSLIAEEGARFDVSGGSVKYEAGKIKSSLLRQGHQVVRLEDAQAGIRYDELITPAEGSGRHVDGYVEGKDAGTLRINANDKMALAASLKGEAVIGPLQRAGASAPPKGSARPDLYASLRPKAGSFELGYQGTNLSGGKTYSLAGIDMRADLSDQTREALRRVREADAWSNSDIVAAWGSGGAVKELPTSALNEGGFGSVVLNAPAVSSQADAVLDLGAQGSFTIDGAKVVDLAGQIRTPGGTVFISAGQASTSIAVPGLVRLRDGAVIDVTGSRVDERAGASAAEGALAVNGGSVTLKSEGTVDLQAGSAIDASAGVWINALGGTTLGTAGSVSLGVNGHGQSTSLPWAPGTLTLDGQVQAFGFGKGGSIAISGVRTLSLGGEAADQGLSLEAAFFTDHGFGAFDLRSQGDLEVASAAGAIQPALRNLQVRATRSPGQVPVLDVVTLPLALRQPMSLSLTASRTPVSDGSDPVPSGGSVHVRQGATIDMGPGGTLALNAGRHLTVAGTLRAQGGQVSLGILGDRGSRVDVQLDDKAGYIEDQQLHLLAGASVDVSGVARAVTLPGGVVKGDVLGGGVINLNARENGSGARGYVVVDSGATLDVSGAAAQLGLGRAGSTSLVSKGAGIINLASAEGFSFAGQVKAHRPDASVSGGLFTATLSRQGEGVATAAKPYPLNDRIIQILAHPADVPAQALKPGVGALSSETLLGSGLDRIRLTSDQGIELGAGVQLVQADPGQAALRELQFNTPKLSARDDQVHRIQAQYVALGDRDLKGTILPSSTASAPQATLGQAGLSVSAGLIDLFGHSAFQGFKAVDLAATWGPAADDSRRDGEIRLVGKAYQTGPNQIGASLDGGLAFAGELSLTAGQVYATTLSHFKLHGSAGGASHLSTHAPVGGSSSAPPLSALGQLSIEASQIDHAGVIRQPFGTITLQATQGTQLLGGSELSVTGAGLNVPVGTIVNGGTWVYNTKGTVNASQTDLSASILASGHDLALPVNKAIRVDGRTLAVDSAAVLDAQAGGDMQAWSFIKGVGGTADTLNRKDAFAVLPGYTYDFAPYDAEIMASTKVVGTGLQAGDQVQIEAGNPVLAQGRYTLLPLRYAVLPGAVVVSASKLGAPDAAAVRMDDGSVLVKGVKTAAGTAQTGGSALSGLLLEPQATVQAKSRIGTTGINDFLQVQAARLDRTPARLPGDAGRVTLSAQSAFDFAAKLQLKGAKGFVAGELDLSMPKIQVASEAVENGLGEVSVKALAASGARSILLGGTRAEAGGEVKVSTQASEVVVAAGTEVLDRAEALQASVGGWMLAARDRLAVNDGVQLMANQGDDGRAELITFQGQGASVVISGRGEVDVRRDVGADATAAGAGVMAMGNAVLKGAAISSSGSVPQGGTVQLDASGAMTLDDKLVVEAATLGLGAQRLSVGGESDAPGAVVLKGGLLTSLQGASRLQLRGYQGIDMVDSLSIGGIGVDGRASMRELTLDTAALRGVGSAADTVKLVAQEVRLLNSGGLQAQLVPAGASSLSIQAAPAIRGGSTGGLTLGQDGTATGSMLLGFARTQLASTGDVVLAGHALSGTDLTHAALLAQGDLTISGARLTATTGAQRSLASLQTLTIDVAEGARTLGERVGVGADIQLKGRALVQRGVIDLAAGQLSLQATGEDEAALTLAAGSTTSVAGFALKLSDSNTLYAQGGGVKVISAGGVALDGAIDVSAGLGVGSQAYAGSLQIKAASVVAMGEQASMQGRASEDHRSGVLRLDAASLQSRVPATGEAGTLDAIVDLAREGGFHRELALRMRQGDQSLNTTLKAQTVDLAADGGSLSLKPHAFIQADSPQGGVVGLHALGDVAMASAPDGDGARISARSTRVGANGGDVLLSSRQGLVTLGPQASIDASGDDSQDGRVILRAALNGDLSSEVAPVLNIAVETPVIRAAEVVAEAVRIYEGDSLVQGQTSGPSIGQQTILGDASLLADWKSALWSATGLSAQPLAETMHLRLGAELQSTGGFVLADDWHLWSPERAGLAPLMLTIRAAGNLAINASLTDGVGSELMPGVPEIPSDLAASFRLVAGADLGAAGVMATRAADDAGDAGRLTLSPRAVVRTSSGSIEMSAAHDIELQGDPDKVGQQAIAMVTGRRSDQFLPELDGVLGADGVIHPMEEYRYFVAATDPAAQFTAHGGRLTLAAGRDITAPATSQFFSSWFQHIGSEGPVDTAWWSTMDDFRMGLGSFGGGNLSVRAERDVKNISAVAPTTGRALITNLDLPVFVKDGFSLENGGDVTVSAGGQVHGGMFLVGRGEGLIDAKGAILPGDPLAGAAQKVGAAPVLALGEGRWTMQATRDLNFNTVLNPTMLDVRIDDVPEQGGRPAMTALAGAAWYLTYSPDSRVNLSSLAGDLAWAPNAAVRTLADQTSSFRHEFAELGSPSAGFYILPTQVTAASFGGNLLLKQVGDGATMVLSPTPDRQADHETQLQLYAHRNLDLVASTGATFLLPGSARDDAPSIDEAISYNKGDTDKPYEFRGSHWKAMAETGLALSQSQGKALISAGGDITMDRLLLSIQKPAEVLAGGDIVNLSYAGQHYGGDDLTRIQAAGSILNTAQPSGPGQSTALSGPGELQVLAGRQLDLGTSAGIIAKGHVVKDGDLPLMADPTAAHIVMGAGLTKQIVLDEFVAYLGLPGSNATLNHFVQQVLQPSPQDTAQAQDQLVSEVKAELKLSDEALIAKGGTVLQGALAYFELMPRQRQAAFADELQNQLFGRQFLEKAGSVYAQGWAERAALLGVSPTDYHSDAFQSLKRDVLFAELVRLGGAAAGIADSTNALKTAEAKVKRQALYDEAAGVISLAGLGAGAQFGGDIRLESSTVNSPGQGSLTHGGVDLLAPGGKAIFGLESGQGSEGLVMGNGGNVRLFAQSDILVGAGKVFAVGRGEVLAWSSQGSIDNGVGSNTSVSVPPAKAKRQADGSVELVAPAMTTGSGIAVINVIGPDGQPVCPTCQVSLYAPKGEIRALDTYIRSPGGINIGAEGVKGADNLKGNVKGGPVAVAAGPAATVRTNQPTESAAAEDMKASQGKAREANAILTVDVLGMGDAAGNAPTAAGVEPADACRPEDKGTAREKEKCRK